MGTTMTGQSKDSPAGRAFDEAIELALEERSPYPERASFIDAGTPYVDGQIKRAFADGRAAVLVSADGSTQILLPDTTTRQAS
jgi:hypothetical protein